VSVLEPALAGEPNYVYFMCTKTRNFQQTDVRKLRKCLETLRWLVDQRGVPTTLNLARVGIMEKLKWAVVYQTLHDVFADSPHQVVVWLPYPERLVEQCEEAIEHASQDREKVGEVPTMVKVKRD